MFLVTMATNLPLFLTGSFLGKDTHSTGHSPDRAADLRAAWNSWMEGSRQHRALRAPVCLHNKSSNPSCLRGKINTPTRRTAGEWTEIETSGGSKCRVSTAAPTTLPSPCPLPRQLFQSQPCSLGVQSGASWSGTPAKHWAAGLWARLPLS